MSATTKTQEENKEMIEDNLSNEEVKSESSNIDLGKLAALKAKNQSKQETKMSAKIVSKKERSLSLGVVGSGQAGCISANSNLYLSKYGLISIKKLFDMKLNSSNLENISVQSNNDICIKLDEDLYTVSIDPETGEIKKGKVLAVWKNKKRSKNTIKLSNGAELTCSKTHPSLVFRPKSRKKAFFSSLSDTNPLSVGDKLFDTRNEKIDFISEKVFVRNIEITPDIGWLLGVFAGDGHDKLHGNSISFYSSDQELTLNIERVCKLLPHTSISINKRPGCDQIEVFGLQFKLFIESCFGYDSQSTYGGIGNKTYDIDVPSCVSASYSDVRVAFLAGMIDSDGTVSKNYCEASIFTTSKKMSSKLSSLISTIGGRSSLIYCKNKNINEKDGFKIKLNGKFNFGSFKELLLNNLKCSNKHSRLSSHFDNEQKSFTTSTALINYNDIEHFLKKGGFKNANDFVNKTGLEIKNWVNSSKQLSIKSFDKMILNLKESEHLNYLSKIVNNLIEVEEISCDDNIDCDFYDLTVETYENYVAGENGLIFTHNSRLAEAFYKQGYDAVVVNTAMQDLKFIDIPDANKLLLEYGLGGAAKELEIGKAAAESFRGEISNLVADKLGNAKVNVLCLSLGGGSGAGSCETMVDILSQTGKPLVVMTVLPMDAEDAQTKANSLETLSKLSKLTQSKVVNNLIVVDNAKLEAIYSNVSQVDFYNVANKAIVEPIDAFNTLSSMPSPSKPLDPMEFTKIFLDGEGLSVYGELTVDNFEEDTAIAEAIINNLSGNLLAGGFDLKQSKYVGYIVAANKETWAKIPSSSIEYANSMVNDLCGVPRGIFKGVYVIDTPDPVVKVYSMFSGLLLPLDRINQLKKETEEFSVKIKNKDENRHQNMKLDIGNNESVSAAQKIKEKIASKNSVFGKFVNGIADRRK